MLAILMLPFGPELALTCTRLELTAEPVPPALTLFTISLTAGGPRRPSPFRATIPLAHPGYSEPFEVDMRMASGAGRTAAPPQTVRGTVPHYLTGEAGVAPTGQGPTQQDLLNAATSTDWLYGGHDYGNTRHAPVAQITPANAPRLQPLCAYQVGVIESFVSVPLVWEGTMYLTTASVTAAIDAATCQERWRHTWQPRDTPLWPNNRGVAIKDGYVLRGTSDGYAVDGRQYIAAESARAGLFFGSTGSPTVFVFGLK